MEEIGTVWALSDFHLPSAKGKLMEMYDPVWKNHVENMMNNISKTVKPNDILISPGDVSWADKIEQMEHDLEFIGKIPCKVLLSEGNHDHWASKYNAVIKALPPNAVWNVRGCFRHGNIAVVSARLWDMEGVYPWPGHVASRNGGPKTAEREIQRLEKSLQQLPQDEGIIRIAMVHFPPLPADCTSSPYTDLMDKYNVNYCIYGHVHGMKPEDAPPAVNATVNKTHYVLSSCDWLQMQPIEICRFNLPEK